MRDEELARIILTELRDNAGASGFRDMVEIAREHGFEVHYEPQRVAVRLREEGYVEADPANPMLARITGRGADALASGGYEGLTERAVARLESQGEIAEARGEAGRE